MARSSIFVKKCNKTFMSIKDIEKAYDIIKYYNGDNNFLKLLNYKVTSNKYLLTDFDVQYILNNFDFNTYEVNKIIKISSDFGKKLNERYDIGFSPDKIRISRVIGEMGNSIHCYIQYRQSIPPILAYVNKNNILTPLETVDTSVVDVDFEKYDNIAKDGRKIKGLQKEGVKFLLANRKCILADSMGCGKTMESIIAAMGSGSKGY